VKLQVAREFAYDAGDFAATGLRAFVVSSSGRGKSYAAGVLCEEALDGGLPIVVFDPEGEYWTLKERYPTLVAGGDHADIPLVRRQRIVRELLSLALSRSGFALVFDLSELREREQQGFYALAAEELFVLKRQHPGTALLVVEEAHLFAPQVYAGACNDVSEELAKRGRKRGLWTVWVTQRSADIAKRVISQCNLLLVGGMDHDRDFQAVKPRLPREVTFQEVCGFTPGTFYASPPGKVVRVRRRRVTHGGDTPGVGRPVALATEVKDASLNQAISGLLALAREEQEQEEREAGEGERLQAELEVARRETEEWKAKYSDLEVAARAAGLIRVEVTTPVLPPSESKTAPAPPGDNHRPAAEVMAGTEPLPLPGSVDDLVVPRAVQQLLQHPAVRDLVEKAERSGRRKDTRVASRHAWELVEVFARVQKAALGGVALALGITHPRTVSALRVQAQELVRAGVLRVADGGFSLDRQSLERAATLYDIRRKRRRAPRVRSGRLIKTG
jgi:hypothetical protein